MEAAPADVHSGVAPVDGHDPGPAAAAVERSLRGSVLVWAGLWLVLIGLSLAADPGTPALSWGLLGAACLAWVSAVAAGRRALTLLVVVLAITAWLQALLSQPESLLTQTEPVLAWVILAAVAAGLSLDLRRGPVVTVVVLIAVGGAAVLLAEAVRAGAWVQAWPQVLAVAAFAVADGMAAATGAGGLRGAARANDAAARALSASLATEASERAHREGERRVVRVLHDTVVNTLGLVRRGVDASMVPVLRERCRTDLKAVGDLWGRQTSASGVACEGIRARIVGRAQSLGLTVREEVESLSADPVPGIVADAVATACGEALLNVAKHAEVAYVRLRMRWTGALLDVAVEDDGRGWEGPTSPGRGIRTSIVEPAAAAGVSVEVTSSPGEGTSVRLRWSGASSAVPAQGLPLSWWSRSGDRAIAQAAAGIGSWISGLCVALTLLAWQVIPSVGSVLALLVLAGTLLVAWTASTGRRRVPVRRWTAAGLLVAAALVVVLPAHEATTCDQSALGWWGADAGLVVLIVVAAVTRGKGWLVGAALAYVASVLGLVMAGRFPSGCTSLPVRVLALDLAILVVVLVVRRLLLRLWSQAAEDRRAAHDRDVAASVAAAAATAADAQIDRVLSEAVPLLKGLAEARLDPADEAVRRRCGDTEEALRALIVLGPHATGLAAVLAAAAVTAHERHQRLTITSPPPAELPCPPAVPEILTNVMTSLPQGASLTVAVLRDGAEVIAALSCRPALGAGAPSVERGAWVDGDDGVTVTTVGLGDQSFAEIRWAQ